MFIVYLFRLCFVFWEFYISPWILLFIKQKKSWRSHFVLPSPSCVLWGLWTKPNKDQVTLAKSVSSVLLLFCCRPCMCVDDVASFSHTGWDLTLFASALGKWSEKKKIYFLFHYILKYFGFFNYQYVSSKSKKALLCNNIWWGGKYKKTWTGFYTSWQRNVLLSRSFHYTVLKMVKNSAAPLALCIIAFDTALDSPQ